MSATSTEAIQNNQALYCAACMTSGMVTWEETPPAVPYARARNRLRRLAALTSGFKSTDTGDRGGPVITCCGCGARIAPLEKAPLGKTGAAL